MKTSITFLTLLLALPAAGYWLSLSSSDPPQPANDLPSVTDELALPTGEPSIDELVTKYVKYTNQRDLDQYLALLHPEDQAALEDVEQKFASWKEWKHKIPDHSFAHAPISDYRLNSLSSHWVLITQPTHEVVLSYEMESGGTRRDTFFAAEQNDRWYLIQPTQLKPPPTVDPSKDEFVYYFAPLYDNRHNWILAFESSNSNDFQLVLSGDTDQILMSPCELNSDQHGRKQLRICFDEIVEIKEGTFIQPRGNDKYDVKEGKSIEIRGGSRSSARQSMSMRIFIEGDAFLACHPVEQPVRSGGEISLAEISVRRNGRTQTHRLFVKETAPPPSEPRKPFYPTFENSDAR